MNYEKMELGKLDNLNEKVFLHDSLNLTGCEISMNRASKGYKVPFNHKHKENEEVYIILKGKGFIEVDGEKLEVQEGSVVKVKPDGIRNIENPNDEDMLFIVIQTKQGSLKGFTAEDAEIL